MGINKNPMTLKELLNTEFPEQQWLVEGLVPADGITIMSAEPGSYKTYMLLDIAIKVTQGEPLFDRFATEKSNVLMVDEDNGGWLLNKRLKQLGAKAKEGLPIYFYTDEGFLIDEKNVTKLLDRCLELNVKLLMIDCLAQVHELEENVAGDMSKIFRQLRRFKAKGIAVLITHHNRKPGSSQGSMRHEMRGSSSILASVDSQVALSRDGDLVTVEQGKQRFERELKPFDLKVSDSKDEFSFTYIGSSEESKVRDLKASILSLIGEAEDGRLFKKQIFELLTKAGVPINKPKLSKVLGEMNKAGEVSSSKGTGNTKYYSLPPAPEPQA
jgi:hypothetical protein